MLENPNLISKLLKCEINEVGENLKINIRIYIYDPNTERMGRTNTHKNIFIDMLMVYANIGFAICVLQ